MQQLARIVLATLAVGLLGRASRVAAEPGELAWQIGPDTFAQYEQTVHERTDSRLDGYARWGEVDDVAGFHGYELDADRRRVVRPVGHVQLLYVPFVFTVPRRATPGTRLDLRGTLPWNWRMGPIAVDGRLEVQRRQPDDPPERVRLAGRALLAGRGAAADREPHRLLRAGTVAWTSVFDAARGAVVEAEFTLAATSVAGTTLRPGSAHSMDAAPHAYRARIGLRLTRLWEHRAPGFQREVDAAIEGGLAWIERRQSAAGDLDGRGMLGGTALALLALVDGGRDPESPAVERGFSWLLDQPAWDPGRRAYSTYELGIALMALERRRTPPEETARRARGERTGLLARELRPRERAWMERAVQVLFATAVTDAPEAGDARGPVTGTASLWRWGYPHVTDGEPRPDPARGWDNSNTQYAVLGLESAARCGVAVPRAAWIGIAEHFLATQAPSGPERRDLRLAPHARRPPPGADAASSRSVAPEPPCRERGWCYGMMHWAEPGLPPTGVSYGSMTAAGIASLAIARSRLAGDASARALLDRIDAAMRDGWAALERMFDVWGNPRYEGWYTYWLYGLERAGMLADVERIGLHDWYWEGAVQLLLRQRRYGEGLPPHWVYDFGAEGSTPWAVLFLKRGTPPVLTPR